MNILAMRNIALRTNNRTEMMELLNTPDMNTRRNLALNDNTPADILEILAYDPTANVSYAASNHINYIGKIRDFSRDVIHPCVTCKKSYDLFNCSNCSEIKPY